VTKAAFRVNSEELAGSQEVDFSAAAVLRRMGEAAVRCIERASVINDFWHESKEGGEMDRRAIKLGICGGYALLFVLLGSHALSADSPPVGSYNLPSKQQTLTFLTETIEWYRYFSAERQVGTEPFDLLFFDNNQPISAQIVQLSFDFARTDASLATTAQDSPPTQGGGIPNALSSDSLHLIQMEVKSEAESKKAGEDLKSIKTKLATARRADRKKLEAESADAQTRLTLLQARSKSLLNLVDLIQANDVNHPQTTDFRSLVESLARTIPEAANPGLPVQPAQPSSFRSDPKPPNSGILALASEVSMLERKLRTVDEGVQLTDKLARFSDNLRTPLTGFVNQAVQSGDLAADNLQSRDSGRLRQQTASLDQLTDQITRLAPAMAALDKQRVLLTVYKSRLTQWRKTVVNEYTDAWKNLILHLVVLALVIAFLTGVAVALRRITVNYAHDANRRRMFLVVQRTLIWLAIVLVIAFAFAPELSSLATFLGLLTAGIAVALQNVILAVVGYFLLVGKLGIRVGDRLRISGVTGDVIDVGLLQFQLREVDQDNEQRTGNVATFSNSFVFVSPATGLLKFGSVYGNANQREVAKRMSRV